MWISLESRGGMATGVEVWVWESFSDKTAQGRVKFIFSDFGFEPFPFFFVVFNVVPLYHGGGTFATSGSVFLNSFCF